jgi:signal transduction histidine kinase
VPTLLIADDEPVILSMLGRFLAAPGRTVLLAGSAAEARTLAETQGPVDVALLDKNLGDASGLEVAAALKARRPETEIILVTAYASFESAVEAIQLGLYDYLSKPIDDFDALRLRIDNALAKVQLVQERRQAGVELRHLQKMDAIGRLAGGIGHDLANMLAVIVSWVEELTPGAEGTARQGLEEIQGAAGRATKLVRQMMTLARRGPAESKRLSLNLAIEEVARLLRRSLGSRITLAFEPAPDLWWVVADPSLLGQVFLNLAVNARDAMPEGGTLTIRTENLAGSRRPAGDGLPQGDAVLVTVTDQGTGMSEEVRERIFEPFFTTKARGEGTGLGLSIVYGIVRQAGGDIQVESAPGRGTTFRLTLPRAPDDEVPGPEARRSLAAEGAVEASTGTILLAEDDEPVRRLLARALRQAGFQVLEARDGAEAVAVARAHHGPIDLLLSDAIMGALSGPALSEALRGERPELRVLLVTGFPADPAVIAFAAAGGEVLQKPFRSSAVVEAVRRMLAGPSR